MIGQLTVVTTVAPHCLLLAAMVTHDAANICFQLVRIRTLSINTHALRVGRLLTKLVHAYYVIIFETHANPMYFLSLRSYDRRPSGALRQK